MEDGAFLAKCLKEVVESRLDLQQAISLYQAGRMPKAHIKQQVSYLNGAMWMLPDGPAQRARDAAMEAELRGEPVVRSSNLYSDPATVLEVYGYDAEAHADREIAAFHNRQIQPRDERTGITAEQAEKYMNWFLPKGERFQISSRL